MTFTMNIRPFFSASFKIRNVSVVRGTRFKIMTSTTVVSVLDLHSREIESVSIGATAHSEQ